MDDNATPVKAHTQTPGAEHAHSAHALLNKAFNRRTEDIPLALQLQKQ